MKKDMVTVWIVVAKLFRDDMSLIYTDNNDVTAPLLDSVINNHRSCMCNCNCVKIPVDMLRLLGPYLWVRFDLGI